MPFPDHISHVLEAFRVRADTKAALYDLYVSLGNDVLEVFADISESAGDVSSLQPEDTAGIRKIVVERYLRRNHPRWVAGLPTASLWHPREAEGRASGAALPLGNRPKSSLPGMLILGRNAHYGGRSETISFDFVANSLDDAIAIGAAEGQQHTIPGSVGETSGTFDTALNIALIWEIQPNVYKPRGERNRAIAKLYRRHRLWHLATLTAALEWLLAQKAAIYILRGEALAVTHEVNPEKPVSRTIAHHHDRTVDAVLEALGLEAGPAPDSDGSTLLESEVMNHALRGHALRHGITDLIRKLR